MSSFLDEITVKDRSASTTLKNFTQIFMDYCNFPINLRTVHIYYYTYNL